MGTPTSFRRLASVATALGLVLLAVTAIDSRAAGTGASSGACGVGVKIDDSGNGWLAMHPAFPTGGNQVTALAAPPFNPNLLYATNGSVVMRSRDAGCSWAPVFTAPVPTGAPLASSAITALAAPSSANTSATVYVGITSTLAGLTQPSIASSNNEGTTWTTVDGLGRSGLPASGSVDALTAEAQVPQVAYALIGLSAAGVDQSSVYATSDGGATWTDRTATTSSTSAHSLVAHPLQPTTVFAIDQDRFAVSHDGGATFAAVPGLSSTVSTYSIASGAGGIRIAAADTTAPAVHLSTDGGVRWSSVATPLLAQSVAAAPLQDLLAISDGQQMFLVAPGKFTRPTGPNGGAPLDLGISAPTSTGFTVTGLRAGAVMQATYTLNGVTVPPKCVNVRGVCVLSPIQLIPPGAVTQFPSTLTPVTKNITLTAGTSTFVPYQLLVPRTPTPVDVMFLVDTTNSMGPVIDGLRQGIAQIAITLDTTGLDAEFGVGDFRDYEDPWGSAQPGDWPYELDAKVGPAGPALQAALGSLQATGGTADGGESALTALYQSTTGDGDLEFNHTFVAPGEDAGYRAKALKLVMVSTDTEPHYGGEQVQTVNGQNVSNPGPGYDDVIQALRSHHVHEIGLWIDPGSGRTALAAMKTFAKASDTVAPVGGVDCNGDGTIDVQAGDPLVCKVGSETGGVGVVGVGAGTNVAPGALSAAVVGLATEIPDEQPVSLTVTRGRLYAAPVGRPTTVNMHADNELAYGLDLHCPTGGSGQHPITVDALTPVRSLATAAVTLTCVTTPLPITPLAAGPIALRAAAIAPAPPPPAPNPLPNPNVNLNQAPSLNLNGAIAQQQEEQAQLAYAEEDGRQVDLTQLAMSARRTSSDADAVFVAGAAVLTAAAGGVAYGRRWQYARRSCR